MDPPLTLAQRHYLEAFDRFLRAETFLDRRDARESMAVRLNFVMAEKNMPLPSGTRWSERHHQGNNRAHGNERRAA